MSTCKGCGGIVGRDCFNPFECEWISHDMERQAAQRYAERQCAVQHDARIAELERQVADKKERLLSALERASVAESTLRSLVDECDNDRVPGWEGRMQACIDLANRVLAALTQDKKEGA